MTTKQYIKGSVKIDKASGGFSVIASTPAVDRQGESIDQNGWDLTNYKNNPVILWAHDYSSLPIAKANNTGVVDNQLVQDGEFASHSFAQEVKQAYIDGFLNTVSVGFIPLERNGNVITKAELLEVSFVPVPANPQALSLMRGMKGMSKEKDALIELIEKCAEVEIVEPTEIKEEEPAPIEDEKPKASTEIQSVILAKDTFPTLEEAKAWVVAHDFHEMKYDETDTQWRFRQFDPSMCSENSFRTINITDGVDAVICVPQNGKTCGVRIYDTSEKSGRVISQKNRDLISSSISAMKTSIASLEDLLVATETPEKAIEEVISEVKKIENGLVEIPVELLKELLSQTRVVDRNVELSNAVLKRILNKVN